MVLADLGAQVDKVEDTGAGDYLRIMPPHIDGRNAIFDNLNRNKRSLVLDLKKPLAQAAARQLLAGYDVLVETFRPGVMKRFGLDYETLAPMFPRLVYCSLTGYGGTGPLAERAGHDLNYQARAGVLGMTGPVEGPPQMPGAQVADLAGAQSAVAAIAAALFARTRTGAGRQIDIGLCESAAVYAMFGFGCELAGMKSGQGQGVLMGAIAPYHTYRTSDGRAVVLAALEPKFWIAFCAATGLQPEMEALVPGPHQAALKARLEALFASRTRQEWAALGAQHDCCLEPVVEPDELALDEQLVARGVVARDSRGALHLRSSMARDCELGVGPQQGQHSREILREAGVDDAAFAQLVSEGASR